MKRSKRRRRQDSDDEDYRPRGKKLNFKVVSRKHGQLNSDLFQDYFEALWKEISSEKKDSFTYLDCLWFWTYTQDSRKEKVLSWIKKRQIFSKRYVFVPIVHWNHWCLLILCNFGGTLESQSGTPCILLLDSLQTAGPERYERDIRKFVLDIYEAEGRPENQEQVSQIPFLVPKVPQQRNGEECGTYVLYFTSLFMKSAPENFSVNEGYPYFMKEDWFGVEDYKCFCKELTLCKQVNPQVLTD